LNEIKRIPKRTGADFKDAPNIFYPGINWDKDYENENLTKADALDSVLAYSYFGSGMFNGAFHLWLAYKGIRTDLNYLSAKTDCGYHPIAFAHSGGTRTLISKIESGEVRADFVVLAAPILISQKELQELVDDNRVKKIVIFQSPNDIYFAKTVTIDIAMPETDIGVAVNDIPDVTVVMPSSDPFKLPDADVRMHANEMTDMNLLNCFETAYWGGEGSKQRLFMDYPNPVDNENDTEKIIVIKKSYAEEAADINDSPHNLLREDMVAMFLAGEYPFDGKIGGLEKVKR
jgi:hypothetical protein